jgi:two-component system capsular synthesis response regulator RcsB
MDSQHIRVAIADDHPVIRVGIEAELDRIPGIQLIGSARDSTELVELLGREPCDVVVTDYSMPGGTHGDGLVLLAYIAEHYPAMAIVVVTAIDKAGLIRTLLSRGIVNIVSKADATTHIVPAV